MKTHVLLEWRDPFESDGIYDAFGRAASLAREGRRVSLLLVRDGVSAAARGEHVFWFAELGRLGVEVIADLESLRARGISVARLSRWVTPTTVTLPVDALIEERYTEWITDSAALRAAS